LKFEQKLCAQLLFISCVYFSGKQSIQLPLRSLVFDEHLNYRITECIGLYCEPNY